MEKYLKNVKSRDKLFKDKELRERAKHDAEKLIVAKKQAFFDEKLLESDNKPKELWSTLKSLGMPKKIVVSNFNAIDDNSLTYDIKTMSKICKDFFLNLAEFFPAKLPDPSSKYNLESLFLYYWNFVIPEVFHNKSSSGEKVLKIMENIEISKAAGIDKLPGRFIKDDAETLSKPISEICSLSISHGMSPNFCKVAKLKPVFKKGGKVDPSNYRLILLLPLISKAIEKVVQEQANTFLSGNKILYNYQPGFRANQSTNLCLSFLTDKII